MQPDTFALAIMWTVWGLAALAVGYAVWSGRRRMRSYKDFLARHPRIGAEGRPINPAPETLARFGR
jgi:hypothetical protein